MTMLHCGVLWCAVVCCGVLWCAVVCFGVLWYAVLVRSQIPGLSQSNLVPRGRDPFGQRGDRDLWPGPIPEVRDSRTSRHSAHAQSQV